MLQSFGIDLIQRLITWGLATGLATICVTGGQAIEPQPEIVGVEPPQFAPGDVIEIRGRNFGNDPAALCVAIRNDLGGVGLRALAANDNCIIACVGAVPPGFGEVMIMVGKGRGVVGKFQPVLNDIVLDDNVWVWRGIVCVASYPKNSKV